MFTGAVLIVTDAGLIKYVIGGKGYGTGIYRVIIVVNWLLNMRYAITGQRVDTSLG